jgi:uncharacterized protein YerC
MTQVSRIPLPKDIEHQMFMLFHRVFAELHTQEDVAALFDDLLTPNEKIMLGKRLAIAFLLDKGHDQRSIHRVLKVSTTTVSSVSFLMQQKGNGYRKVISMVRKEEKWATFINGLDNALEQLFSKKAIHRRAYGGIPDSDR